MQAAREECMLISVTPQPGLLGWDGDVALVLPICVDHYGSVPAPV